MLTAAERRNALQALGLTPKQAAQVTETDRKTVYRLINQDVRAPNRWDQLLQAYLSGYRPENWPKDVHLSNREADKELYDLVHIRDEDR